MPGKFKIAVLGIGGVGGYIGGKLAAHYFNSDTTEIIFIARGEAEKKIKSNGLKLITQQGEQVVHPAAVISKPDGYFDLILCCVKSYHLEAGIEFWKPSITDNTIILPLLNGVNATARIKKILPNSDIWDGCIYIVSRLVSPGIVKETGNFHRLYFGSRLSSAEKLKHAENIFVSAGINAYLTENMIHALWEKFFFISPLATLTSYLDISAGGIVNNKENKKLFLDLVTELKNVADAMNIPQDENTISKTLYLLDSVSPETTTSMQNDFRKGGQTELDSLTGYVVSHAKRLNIPAPCYEKIYNKLNTS